MKLNIAFYTNNPMRWMAGDIYLRNLFSALQGKYRDELGLFLLTPAEGRRIQDHIYSIGADNVIFFDIPRHFTPLWTANKLLKKFLLREIIIEKILKKHEINVLFSAGQIYKFPKIAKISWLFDFNYAHLPDMFDKKKLLRIKRARLYSAKVADRIILMSDVLKKELESLMPMYAYKGITLRVPSHIPSSIYSYSLDSISKLYNLPRKFFYLPNQFWKHKNHERVFCALKILKDKGVKVFIVCTGYPYDCRHPKYFKELWQKVTRWGIKDQIIYHWWIPREHVLLLMRQSICVINPSLYEGWGLSVDEARSVGKRTLLSDIPAHCEQNPPKAVFFNPYNSEELAERLGEIWEQSHPGPDTELEEKSRKELPERMKECATSFFSIINEIIK